MNQHRADIAAGPDHASSPTDHVLRELQPCGYRPLEGESGLRGVPDDQQTAIAVADIFDALIATLCGTSPDAGLDEVLWSAVNIFLGAAGRIACKLDDNEQAQRRGQIAGCAVPAEPAFRVAQPLLVVARVGTVDVRQA